MTEKKKFDFKKIWTDAKEFGADIEDFTKRLVEVMKKEGVSEQKIIAFIEVFSEIDSMVKFLCETKLGIDPFERWHRKYKKHQHVAGQVFIPEEDKVDVEE